MTEFSYSTALHPLTGWQLIRLNYVSDRGSASATITPDVGSNLFQFAVDGIEYLHDFQKPLLERTSLAGTPILYPSPNRMRDARFIFDGETFSFEPNRGKNFSHGFVRHEPWQWEQPVVTAESVSLRSSIHTDAGSRWFKNFPICNTLVFIHTLRVNTLRMEMEVHNEDRERRLPFGLAIHPFFRIHGERKEVLVQVPAEKWMVAEELLPTGELVEMAEGPADLRQPASLQNLDLDHVAWGMSRARPATITYLKLNKRLVLHADDFFTHAVVYTPPGKPFFCIENQSCSTDAHNLYARDNPVAHLAILAPGESIRTWIEFQLEEI